MSEQSSVIPSSTVSNVLAKVTIRLTLSRKIVEGSSAEEASLNLGIFARHVGFFCS